MPQGFMDKAVIPIPCKRGHKTKKTVGWLKQNREVTCGGCGRVSEIDADEYIRNIRESEDLLSDVERAWLKSVKPKGPLQ